MRLLLVLVILLGGCASLPPQEPDTASFGAEGSTDGAVGVDASEAP